MGRLVLSHGENQEAALFNRLSTYLMTYLMVEAGKSKFAQHEAPPDGYLSRRSMYGSGISLEACIDSMCIVGTCAPQFSK